MMPLDSSMCLSRLYHDIYTSDSITAFSIFVYVVSSIVTKQASLVANKQSYSLFNAKLCNILSAILLKLDCPKQDELDYYPRPYI